MTRRVMHRHDPVPPDTDERVAALPLWAFYLASETIHGCGPTGIPHYVLPAGVKLRLLAAVGEALVRARSMSDDNIAAYIASTFPPAR